MSQLPRARARVLLPFALVAACSALPLAAQDSRPAGQEAHPAFDLDLTGEPDVPSKEGKVLRARRIAGAPPKIDGVLDDAAWLHADSTTGMVQWEPANMEPMTEPTVVRVLYDDRYIYIGVRLYDSRPDSIVTGIGRRDDAPASDAIYVGFDTQHDHLTGYVFGANPSGVQDDSYFFDDTSNDRDYTAVWTLESGIDERGWTAEFRIPFSQMRFRAPPDGRAVWGFDFRREIQRRNEQGQWVGRPRGEQGQVSRWGHLVFEEGIESPRRVEVMPFAVARGELEAAASGLEESWDGGLDARVGLGSGATLSATVNPDFGQVEADPAVLNLSIYETFLPEKRPFFLEDSRVFIPSYGLFQLFHSRRIGRRPSRFNPVEAGDVVLERPDQTTILGAAKITGKGQGYTYGVLSALTSEEHVALRPIGSPDRIVERPIEPRTSYNAARVQRDILGGSSNVGLLATGVMRDGAADAFAAGTDYRIRWSRNRAQINGHWAVTHAPVGGEMVTGFGGVANLGWNAKHWDYGAHFDYFSPNFRVTDLGFLRTRVDRTSLNGWAGYGNPEPGARVRSWNVNLNVGQSNNGDGLVFDRFIGVGGYARLLNFWQLNGFVALNPQTLDDLDTRGGPPIVRPRQVNGFLAVRTDPRRSWSMWLGTQGSRSAEGGWRWAVDPELEVRPSPRLQLAVSGGYSATVDPAQWIRNRDADGDGETDYVYGRLRSDVVNLTLRGSAAVNRDLTLQAYLQPFVAVGDYTDLKRLARPRSFDFDPLTEEQAGGNPDFANKSLRGTFVLRWEYEPGSTLYAAWNFSGRDGTRPGEFRPLSDLGDAFGADLDGVLLLKASYWMSL